MPAWNPRDGQFTRCSEDDRTPDKGNPVEMMSLPRTPKTLFPLALGFAFLTSGCGYSEEEWQAQLDKYEQLASEHQAEKDAHEQTKKELEDARMRVANLKTELERMGLNLDNLSTDLQKVGTEKEHLSKDLEQLQAALEEYKARAAQLERIKARFEELQSKLKKLVDQGLKVEIRHNRMVIRLPGDVLFASGSDKLRDEGQAVVGTVADVIRKDEQLKKRFFQVAGHTDDRPLSGGRFGDNWGLSAMRARSVLTYLVDDPKKGGGGLNPKLLHAAGYSDIDPVATNTTDEGRKQNRRVELVIMPDVEEMLDLQKL
jgi:chemotaxis protein MotB